MAESDLVPRLDFATVQDMIANALRKSEAKTAVKVAEAVEACRAELAEKHARAIEACRAEMAEERAQAIEACREEMEENHKQTLAAAIAASRAEMESSVSTWTAGKLKWAHERISLLAKDMDALRGTATANSERAPVQLSVERSGVVIDFERQTQSFEQRLGEIYDRLKKTEQYMEVDKWLGFDNLRSQNDIEYKQEGMEEALQKLEKRQKETDEKLSADWTTLCDLTDNQASIYDTLNRIEDAQSTHKSAIVHLQKQVQALQAGVNKAHEKRTNVVSTTSVKHADLNNALSVLRTEISNLAKRATSIEEKHSALSKSTRNMDAHYKKQYADFDHLTAINADHINATFLNVKKAVDKHKDDIERLSMQAVNARRERAVLLDRSITLASIMAGNPAEVPRRGSRTYSAFKQERDSMAPLAVKAPRTVSFDYSDRVLCDLPA